MYEDWQMWFALGLVALVCLFAIYRIVTGGPKHLREEFRREYKWWCLWCLALKHEKKDAKWETGFVLPVVLYATAILALSATVMVVTAGLERQASHATKLALYDLITAQNGVASIVSKWTYNGLKPGQQRSETGEGWTAVIQRVDSDVGPNLFRIVVTVGSRQVEKWIQRDVVATFGLVGTSAIIVRGDVEINTDDGTGQPPLQSSIDGRDTAPPGWAGCMINDDIPGVTMDSTSTLSITGDSWADGAPSDTVAYLTDETFNNFGGLTWAEFRAKATAVVIGGSPRDLKGCVPPYGTWCGVNDVGPRYNADGSCDTSHELNWGTDDPLDPCVGHFPIVLVRNEIDLNRGSASRIYGQGVFVLDWDEVNGTGAELDIEQWAVINGIILGRGCVEVQENAQVYGTVFVDGTYSFAQCNTDATLDVHNGGHVSYSSCALERVLSAHDLAQWTLTKNVRVLEHRSWVEGL